MSYQEAMSAYLITAISVIGFIRLLIRNYNARGARRQTYVLLQLIPPAESKKDSNTTSQLYVVIQSLLAHRSLWDELLGRFPTISLETVSDREHGLCYYIRLNETMAPILRQQLVAYLPTLQIREVSDYIDAIRTAPTKKVIAYKQIFRSRSVLVSSDSIKEHDPISYIQSALSGLRSGEVMSYQLIIQSCGVKRWQRHRNDGTVQSNRTMGAYGSAVFKGLAYFFIAALKLATEVLTEITAPHRTISQKRTLPFNINVTQSERKQGITPSVSSEYVALSMRLTVTASSEARLKSLLRGFNINLETYSVASPNQFRVVKRYFFFPGQLLLLRRFIERQMNPRSHLHCVVSLHELGRMYHLPYGYNQRIDNAKHHLSRTLAAPSIMKQRADAHEFDLMLGLNDHHGEITAVGLSAAERSRHMYIIGGTGMGKTTLLHYAIAQDIKHGKGIALIDPHGDLADAVLQSIPKERHKDVVYFNPTDIGYPIGLNILELHSNQSPNQRLLEQDLVMESVVSIFRKLFSEDDSGGHRIEYVLRNTIQTAFTLADPTLFTIFQLLTDPIFRRQVTSQLDDQDLINFWKNEIGRAGDFQRVKMTAGVTAKIGRFLFSVPARRVLEQTKSTIDFDDLIQSGKILICNFSKGLLGEDTASLFGSLVLAKIQLASLRRSRIAFEKRNEFYLYVDEFQNFATSSFLEMLSEARKYKLFLTMAEQSVSQHKDVRSTQIILANVGSIVCFRTGNVADEAAALPLFTPYLQTGEIMHLPAHSFYLSVLGSDNQEPVSASTILLDEVHNTTNAQIIRQLSRRNYARSYGTNIPQKPTVEVANNIPARIGVPQLAK